MALQRWTTRAQGALDQIAEAHAAVGGTGPGRRYATLQVNHAYAMLVSSQFQGFCRDLHTEAADVLVSVVQPLSLGSVLQAALIQGRKLDNALHARNFARQKQLDHMNTWRNAIAHQDWTKAGPELRLATVQGWRSNCAALARAFDLAVSNHLAGLVGKRPW